MTLSYEVLHLGDEGQRMSVYQAAAGRAHQDTLALLALLAAETASGPSRARLREGQADGAAGAARPGLEAATRAAPTRMTFQASRCTRRERANSLGRPVRD